MAKQNLAVAVKGTNGGKDVKKFLVICSYSRMDGDDGGYLSSTPSYCGGFNTVGEALKEIKIQIEETINDECNSYEGDEDDEEMNELKSSYETNVMKVADVNKILKNVSFVEAGSVRYDDGYNYMAETYSIIKNPDYIEVDKAMEKKCKDIILQWLDSYRYDANYVEEDNGVAITETDLDDCEPTPILHMGKSWKDLFENFYLDEIVRNYNDDEEDIVDRLGKTVVKFCLGYDEAK